MHVNTDIAYIKQQTHSAAMSQLSISHEKRGFSGQKFFLIPALIAVFSFGSIAYGFLANDQKVIMPPANNVAMHGAADSESSSSVEYQVVEIVLSSSSSDSSVLSVSSSMSSEDVSVSSSSAVSSVISSEEVSSSFSSVHTSSVVSQVFNVSPLPTVPDVAVPLPKSTHAFGAYLTPTSAGTPDFLQETEDDLLAAGGNALVIDVKGSAVFFDADTPIAKELKLVKKQYDLSEILERAHKKNIYVIGRFVALKDAGLARVKPDTLIAYPNTKKAIGYEFVDPENPDVLAYNGEVLCALAQSGIDEVNLDYIRFSTAEVGELRVFSGEEKSRKVGVFVKMAREVVDRCGPQMKLGISTFAILGWNYPINLETLGQDVIAFAPYVDIISPMAYPATFSEFGSYYDPAKNGSSRNYYLVLRTLQGYQEFLGADAWKLRPWIQGYGMLPSGMADQMRAVSDAGLCGFTVWSAQNVYGNTFSAMKNWKQGEGC